MTTFNTSAIRIFALHAFALLVVLSFGTASAQAGASKGKVTDIGGNFICDCSSPTGSCYCIQ